MRLIFKSKIDSWNEIDIPEIKFNECATASDTCWRVAMNRFEDEHVEPDMISNVESNLDGIQLHVRIWLQKDESKVNKFNNNSWDILALIFSKIHRVLKPPKEKFKATVLI